MNKPQLTEVPQPKRADNGRFKPGTKPGPGRPAGSKNKPRAYDIKADMELSKLRYTALAGARNGDPVTAALLLLLNQLEQMNLPNT